ncbi:MAG: replicative DNA helicase [Bacteroidia bacterium]|nr:replicative DNA helicase [Bacteroidia bacterium]
MRSIRNDDLDLGALSVGKLQPQAIPLEEAVLGALMLDKDAIAIVLDIINEESFYVEGHQMIYRAMRNLFDRSQPIDLLTVSEELKKIGKIETIGGPYYLVELTNKVASAANIEYHSKIIAQKHIQRELIKVSGKTIKDAYDDTTDVFTLLDETEQGLYDITQNNLSKNYEKMGSLARKALKELEEMSEKEDTLLGVPTGFNDIDNLTLGWQPSDLIIIAARPSMGKTAFTLALARNAAVDYKIPVAFFSLEMSNLQLVHRLISMEAEIESQILRSGKLEEYQWQQLQTTIEQLGEVPLFIDDTPAINIFELRAKCRRLKKQHDIKLIVIDYLQLMTASTEGKSMNREQEISTISRSLKSLAKEINVPVIALSQLSRAVETRGGSKRPMLSDLRESGAIEQDADIVSFIYRPEYYDILEDEEGNSLKGVTEIIVAKHRNGATDTIKLRFINKFAKFTNYEDPIFSTAANPNAFINPYETIITRPSKMNDDDSPFE